MQFTSIDKAKRLLSSKVFLTMKLIVLFLIISSVEIYAKANAQKINFYGKDIPLDKVFSVIEKQSGYYFFYKQDELQQAKTTTVNLKNASVEQAVNEILKGQPFTYHIEDNTIIVNLKKDEDTRADTRTALPPHDIAGIVKDNKGEALPGVTVRIKGSSNAVATDNKGEYLIHDADQGAVLVFSYTGYLMQEIKISNQTRVNIILAEDIQGLKEVVVVGYGTQEKSDISSAIGSFKPNESNSRPVLGADQLIQGKISGVNVVSGSGTPGSVSRVSIRGIGSLTASNEPLYVIDGVPVSPNNAALFNFGEDMNALAELNPNDIESVDVLKDAASAAIYGSRATNGVIIITTKSGKKGKSRVSFDAYTGLGNIPRLSQIAPANSATYVTVLNEAIKNYNTQNGYVAGNANFVANVSNPYPNLPDVNWVDLLLRTAKTNQANISFSGGSDKGTYYISGSGLSEDGAIKNNNLKKYTAKININQNVASWLKLGANTNYSYTNNNRVPGANLGSSPLTRGLEQRPFDRPYKPDGSYYIGGTSQLLRNNSVQILNEETSYINTYRFLGNFFAEATLAKGLVLKSSLGTDIISTHDYVYYDANHPYGTGNGRIIDSRRTIGNIITENTLNYDLKFHDLNATFLAGYSFQKVSASSNSVDGSGFPSRTFDVNSVAAKINAASSDLTQNALQSYYARANFSYKSKYLLGASIRTDGSSRFAPDTRYGYFPSVSAGWLLSRENFWKMHNVSLKLRTSYGSTGNQEGIGNYSYQALAGGGFNYNNVSGIAITNFGNSTLTWESAHQFDGGFDMGLFNEHLKFTADYFIKNTTNLLYDKPTPATTGFTTVTTNIGSMQNKGLELALSGNVTFGKVTWQSDFNISFIRNKITSLLGDDKLLVTSNNRAIQVGQQVGSFYMYKQIGIYQTDAEVPANLYKTGVRAGDVKFEDVDHNGVIDLNDREIVGSPNPKYSGGWTNSFQYKNFDFNFAFTYSYGSQVYGLWKLGVSRLGSNLFNFVDDQATNRWTGPGTSNTVPRAIYGNTYNITASSRFLGDGSFLRLRNMAIGYTLPQTFLNRFHIERLRVYAQADNLFIITKYFGIDPEVNDYEDPRYLGEDNLVTPSLRTFNFGINVTL